MEKFVTIQHQLPLQERQYTDRQGQQQSFATKGFVLTDGIDTFYAEAVGDTARSLTEINAGVMHMVQLQASVRDFNDKDGKKRYQTEIRIVKMS